MLSKGSFCTLIINSLRETQLSYKGLQPEGNETNASEWCGCGVFRSGLLDIKERIAEIEELREMEEQKQIKDKASADEL